MRRPRYAGETRRRMLMMGVFLGCTASAVSPASGQTNGQANGAIAVVVDAKAHVADLSLRELRRVFAGEQQFWGKGERITLLVPQRGTPLRTLALRAVYEMSENEFTRYWIAKTFRDDVASAPKLMPTQAVTMRLLQSVPGSIGLVSWPVQSTDVRVVRINGKLPGDVGYPLGPRP